MLLTCTDSGSALRLEEGALLGVVWDSFMNSRTERVLVLFWGGTQVDRMLHCSS